MGMIHIGESKPEGHGGLGESNYGIKFRLLSGIRRKVVLLDGLALEQLSIHIFKRFKL